MMKRIVQIALAALAAAWPTMAIGDGVPHSVDEYIFSVPLLTNHIRGVVITPTNSYRVIRSEDVDWLREAFAERNSIEVGRIQHRSVGVGAPRRLGDKPDATMFWNGWARYSDSGWLDPDTPLLSGTRLYPMETVAITNTYVDVFYTNVVTNAISTIEMPMTNGSVSVWTNRWSAFLSARAEQIVTNIHSMGTLDYCWSGDGVFGGYTNTPRMAFGWPASLDARQPSIGEITNAWAALRGTRRLADVGVFITNSTLIVEESASGGDGSPTIHRTDRVSDNLGGIRYELSCGCDANGHWGNSVTFSQPFTAVIPTRFYSDLVTTGGANRVSIEAAFISLHFYYFFSDDRHPSADFAVQTNAIIRLAEPDLDTSSPIAYVRVPLDAKAFCSTVATAAGCPPVPSAGVLYAASAGESHSWNIYADSFVIIYSVTPSVKLPDW